MFGGSSADARDELARVRDEYESSTSWRVTRPLRAAGRLARRWHPGGETGEADDAGAGAPPAGVYDAWLQELFAEQLEPIEAACAAGRAEYALFRDLDDELWALLLTKEFRCYPSIHAFLPEVPDPVIQQLWNGRSGIELAAQGAGFYARVKQRVERQSPVALAEGRVLDFGCGWGRLTRLFARDVEPGMLFGCDPVQGIVDACRRSRVPARVERSDFVPERLPFTETFTLAFSFSVFTHLSEPAHLACLKALHASLAEDALLIVTIRPAAYADAHPELRGTAKAPGPSYLFAPHQADEGHPQYGGGEMHYGEAVIALGYVRERWAELFELIGVDFLIADPQQVVLTLRRRG